MLLFRIVFRQGPQKKPQKSPKSWDLWAKTPEDWWKHFLYPFFANLMKPPRLKGCHLFYHQISHEILNQKIETDTLEPGKGTRTYPKNSEMSVT